MPKFTDNHDLLMAHVPSLDEIPEEGSPDENCTCAHDEDHTPSNGCERRDCTCLFWEDLS